MSQDKTSLHIHGIYIYTHLYSIYYDNIYFKTLLETKEKKNLQKCNKDQARKSKTDKGFATFAHTTISAAGKDMPALLSGVQCLHILQGTVGGSREVGITSSE